jgi:hypothetical protein
MRLHAKVTVDHAVAEVHSHTSRTVTVKFSEHPLDRNTLLRFSATLRGIAEILPE